MKHTLTTMLIALVAVAALVLAACGGGGCDTDCGPDQKTPRVDCSASGVCK